MLNLDHGRWSQWSHHQHGAPGNFESIHHGYYCYPSKEREIPPLNTDYEIWNVKELTILEANVTLKIAKKRTKNVVEVVKRMLYYYIKKKEKDQIIRNKEIATSSFYTPR